MTIALLAGCAAESNPKEPATGQTEELLSAKKTCPKKNTETSCLAAASGKCAWGDQGAGPACFYVGTIVPQPGGGPSMPTVCTHNASETSCLGDPGCAWGDQGAGLACFYVGEIVAQPGGSSGGGKGPATPTVCTHNANETSCLRDYGCAWGDQGKGPECFYVGEIIPQAH